MQIPSDSLFAKYPSGLGKSEWSMPEGLNAEAGASPQVTTSFSDMLASGITKVNDMQQTANEQVQKLLTGQDVNSAEVLTGMQKADMAFRLLVQVRNKLMKAYDDISQIRI